MAFLEINPPYRDFLERQQLTEVESLLALPAVIVSGHPDRQVGLVELGHGGQTIRGYLKREHRIPWKSRLSNAWAGFGFVSNSRREARILQAMRRCGIGCPEWIAVGEDDEGRAFLLVRALDEAVDLRTLLCEEAELPPHRRRELARQVGTALAQLHNAGFDHPDLYSKHVLVDRSRGTIHFLDCQRSRERRRVGRGCRWRDLAALDATLAPELASPRERLVCLRAYLRAAGKLSGAVRQIRERSRRLLRHRHVRELRQPPLTTEAQRVVWLDGEALCATPELLELWQGPLPRELSLRAPLPGPRNQLLQCEITLPEDRRAVLHRRQTRPPWSRLAAWLRRRRPESPELRQAGLLYRLQRHGFRVPRVLAFGQRFHSSFQTLSFLLTEPILGAVPLTDWLSAQLDPPQRRRLLGESATLLRRLHEAGCVFARPFTTGKDCPFGVVLDPAAGPSVVLAQVEAVTLRRGVSHRQALRDLGTLCRMLAPLVRSRTDERRLLHHYLGRSRR